MRVLYVCLLQVVTDDVERTITRIPGYSTLLKSVVNAVSILNHHLVVIFLGWLMKVVTSFIAYCDQES